MKYLQFNPSYVEVMKRAPEMSTIFCVHEKGLVWSVKDDGLSLTTQQLGLIDINQPWLASNVVDARYTLAKTVPNN